MERNELLDVHDIVEAMRRNSAAWCAAAQDEKMALEQKNRELARTLVERHGVKALYNDLDGTWYIGTAKLFDTY